MVKTTGSGVQHSFSSICWWMRTKLNCLKQSCGSLLLSCPEAGVTLTVCYTHLHRFPALCRAADEPARAADGLEPDQFCPLHLLPEQETVHVCFIADPPQVPLRTLLPGGNTEKGVSALS